VYVHCLLIAGSTSFTISAKALSPSMRQITELSFSTGSVRPTFLNQSLNLLSKESQGLLTMSTNEVVRPLHDQPIARKASLFSCQYHDDAW